MKKIILGIIPARYASTRFPGKPLILIRGKSMIQRVWEQAGKSRMLSEVIVATDDRRIFDHVTGFGGKAVMTSEKHPTGTDRLAEVIRKRKGRRPYAVVNIQGDEPFLEPAEIDRLCRLFRDGKVSLATLAAPLTEEADLHNPSIIKLALDRNKNALLFSRSPIPFNRAGVPLREAGILKHIGIYGYRTGALLQVSRMKQGRLESLESLEQLRWLENGMKIRVGFTHSQGFSIDTPGDLLKIKDQE